MKIDLHVDDSTQYTTAWSEGKPVATLVRRRVYERGPKWRVYDTAGALLFTTNCKGARVLARLIQAFLAKHGV